LGRFDAHLQEAGPTITDPDGTISEAGQREIKKTRPDNRVEDHDIRKKPSSSGGRARPQARAFPSSPPYRHVVAPLVSRLRATRHSLTVEGPLIESAWLAVCEAAPRRSKRTGTGA
jgi:hypothetical protein